MNDSDEKDDGEESSAQTCSISSYYGDSEETYGLHQRFINATTGVSEQICIEWSLIESTEGYEFCETTNIYIDDDTWSKMTTKTQEIISVTVGCRECDTANGYYPSVREVPEYGAYVSECFNYTYNVDPYLDEDVDDDFVLEE